MSNYKSMILDSVKQDAYHEKEVFKYSKPGKGRSYRVDISKVEYVIDSPSGIGVKLKFKPKLNRICYAMKNIFLQKK